MAGKNNIGYQEIDLNDSDGNALAELEAEMASVEIEDEPAPKNSPRRELMSGQVGSVEVDDDPVELEIIDEESERKDGKKEAKKEERPKENNKGPSRAQKRITKLAQQRKELEVALEEERRKNFELQKQYSQTRYTSAKSQRTMTAQRLQSLEHQLLQAAENNDWKRHSELTSQIADTNLRLRVLDYEANTAPQKGEYTPPPRPSGPPEAAEAWLEENPWMNDPFYAEKRQITERIADELIRRGMDPTDDSFYFEIDNALDAIERHIASQAEQQEEPEEQSEEEPVARPAVQGRGRQAPRRPSKRTVRLTADEKQMADDLGLDYGEYAQSLEKYNDTGWTEL